MRIAGTLRRSLVNGDGIRFVVFTQGCEHHCPGCQNPETWVRNGGQEIPVETLAEMYHNTPYVDGITLSGGDPFYQHRECCRLLKLLPNVNVWVYTGFEWDDVKDSELVKLSNVIVTGPYVEALRCEGHMYGSSNQELHLGGRETHDR